MSPEALAVLARCGAGGLSPALALSRLLLERRDVDALRRALEGAQDGPAAAGARAVRALLDANLAGARQALRIIESAPDEPLPEATLEEELEGLRRLFDQAVRTNAAASVALYSLGDERLLAEATGEAVALMETLGVAAPGRHLLDLGCGIGRFALALAPRVASITGVDASPAMVAAARARCAGLANVRLLEIPGRDLAAFADGAVDAVIAVDSFPYLYRAGGPAFARVMLGEVRRVLRAGGDALILNLSYRGDADLDRADAAEFAAGLEFELLRNGTTDLRSWDGLTFHLRCQRRAG